MPIQSKKSSLLRTTYAIFALEALERCFGFFTGLLIARLLGPSRYGSYVFIMSLVSILLIFSRLGQPEVALRNTAIIAGRTDCGQVRRLAVRCYCIITIMSALVIFSSYISLFFFSVYFQIGSFLPYTIGFLIVYASSFLDCSSNILRGIGKFALSKLLVGILPLGVLILALLTLSLLQFSLTETEILSLRFLAVSVSIVLGNYCLYKILPNVPSQKSSALIDHKVLLKDGALFALNSLSHVILVRVDILMLNVMTDSTTVGLYNVAVAFSLLIHLGYSISTVILPAKAAALHSAGKVKELERIARQFAIYVATWAMGSAIFLTLFGQDLLLFFLGNEFADAYKILPILAMGFALPTLLGDGSSILNMTGYAQRVLLSNVVATFVNIVLNVWLVLAWGAVGAAVATAVSYGVMRSLLYWDVLRFLGLRVDVASR